MKVTDEVYREYAKTVCGYLMSLTHDAALAEELTQETFYQAVKSVHRFDGSCRFSTWLCAIARNQLMAYRRKHPTQAEVRETEAERAPTPEQQVLSECGRMVIMKKLHDMDERIREVMYLRIFGELSFAQIGEITGQTENWARVTYYRGKERLRKELEQDE